MSAGLHKGEVITLKVDEFLLEKMSGIKNRSEFIRSAILAALGNCCPVCNGSGFLSVHQKEHWNEFNRNHKMSFCMECHETHLICNHEGA